MTPKPKLGQMVMLATPENETGIPIGTLGFLGKQRVQGGAYSFAGLVDGKLNPGYIVDLDWVVSVEGLSQDKIKMLSHLYGVTPNPSP